jgi:hypothetical protein
MPCRAVSFPLETPGDRAGAVLMHLQRDLDASIGLGSDGIVTVEVDAESHAAARRRVLDAIVAHGAEECFDLSFVRLGVT